MKKAVINEECEESTTFNSLVIREGCSFVGFFFAVRLMMAMMTISFALQLQTFLSLWIAKND